MHPKRYTFHELRDLARDRGVPRWGYKNKDQLCKALGVVRVEHLPKYTLTRIGTCEVTKWRSTSAISKAFGTNTGNIFYSLKVGKPLTIAEVSYRVQRI